MKAGGRRLVTIPPELGFGERGAVLRPTEHVPDKQVCPCVCGGGGGLQLDCLRSEGGFSSSKEIEAQN